MGSTGETQMTLTQVSDGEPNLFSMQLASASVLLMDATTSVNPSLRLDDPRCNVNSSLIAQGKKKKKKKKRSRIIVINKKLEWRRGRMGHLADQLGVT
ncbi:hypothetical protein GBA52_012167 [Prunus armeniaca]|nr:hypothetical protein GBA52_012167 [Prunus armeniaca]